jgi:hypothetical protein
MHMIVSLVTVIRYTQSQNIEKPNNSKVLMISKSIYLNRTLYKM